MDAEKYVKDRLEEQIDGMIKKVRRTKIYYSSFV